MNDAGLRRSDRAFWISASVHASVVAALCVVSLGRGCARPPKPRELVTYIDVATFAPTPPTVPTLVEPPPLAPPPPPRDIPEPRPRETPPRLRETPPRVERSERRVERPPTPPRRAPPTARQIAEQLSRGMPAAPSRDDFPGWYFALVKQELYEAWNQPGGPSASAGHTALATIRVERDGTVSRRHLDRPSGNAAFDQSVQRALDSVRRMRPLPDTFRGPYRDISIEFELTRS